jgi:cell division protein ZapE
VGRGKSAVMDLFFATLPDAVPKRRVHFHEFMLEVHAYLHTLRQGGQGAVDDALPKFAAHVAATARVLCFDEFHVKDVADAMILSRLFTALWDAGVVIVATSNWPPDQLYAGGLQRDLFLPFIALLKARMNVVAVSGPHDYRTDRVAGRPVYFHPLGPASDAALDQIFRDLTDIDPEAAEPETLDVLGHTVTVPRAARGVARASFADLCEKPLAAQDYLAIADRFHTLILDHVPRLTYDRRNETKRLMILVDILYERRRRLIISADAPLDRLFVDNEHAFEFQRTLSRLQEMASEGYPG